MRGKWALLCVSAVLAGMAAGTYLRYRKPQQAASPAGPPQPPSPRFLTLTGKVRAVHVVVVNAEVDGNIDAFEANVGDEVYAGQELARIGSAGLEVEQAEAAAEMEKAQARVEAAEKNVSSAQLDTTRAHAAAQRARAELDRLQKVYDRQKVLVAAGATPRLTYDKAESEYDRGREEWEAVDKAARGAEERVRDTMKELDSARKILTDRSEQAGAAQSAVESGVVLAPVAGVVVGRNGEVGQLAVELAGGLFQIGTDLYDLEVAVDLAPGKSPRPNPRQPALVIIPDLQGTSVTGEVKEVNEREAVIIFKSPAPAIRPGMVAEVQLAQ